ncbi:hypothetical protein RJT34_15316 [Clitoria ternatea]|uniref:Uncharacterized protein n=1 Tax=Clitoria ternatea TaxID=43366 RepID=A0AAN9JS49_CLITE
MDSSKRQANKFFVAVTRVVVVLAKQASRLPRKLKATAETVAKEDLRIQVIRKSPKKLLSNINSKTLSFLQKKNKKKREDDEWGHGGVWQKAILMGDKCEPLDFSGVIYYNSNGKQVNEMPVKSPRASPMTGTYFIRHGQQQRNLFLE